MIGGVEAPAAPFRVYLRYNAVILRGHPGWCIMGAGRREQSTKRRGVVPPAAEFLYAAAPQVQDAMFVISTGDMRDV